MAAAHSTSKVRPHRNRASKFTPRKTRPPLNRQALRDGLKAHVRTIRDAMFVAITCGSALRHGDSDNDQEVAYVLRVYCSNKLFGAIQETGLLLALLDGRTDVDPESDEIGCLANP